MDPTSSISGLASGLDTASIIGQLMQLEARPQTDLKSRLTAQQSELKSLQSLNSQLAALGTKAAALALPGAWTPTSVSSSSTAVSVSTTSGAIPGSLTFTVNQTASAHRLTFATTAQPTDTVVAGGTDVTLTIGSQATTLDTGDGTLAGLVAALNAPGTGVRAGTVTLDDGTMRLSVTAAETGSASTFTLTNADGSDLLGGAAVVAGQDAAITVGADVIHSSSNTFTGVVPGLTFSVSTAAVGQSVDLTVATDPAKVAASVKELVDAVNASLAQMDKLTAYDPVTKTSGPLAGESTLRGVANQLLNSIYPSDGSSMAEFGIQVDRYGRIVFDQAAFTERYAEDPGTTAAAFTNASGGGVAGFASRLATVTDNASNKYTGTVTSRITGQSTQITRINASIEDWDRRLALRRDTLTRQFTALETALSRMNSQSSWLSNQLSSLETS